MKKQYFLILLVIVIFNSCIKYEHGCVVQGNVTYDSTGVAAEGIPVSLILCTREARGQSYYSSSSQITTYSDSKGDYIIYYKKKRGWQYSYSVSANFTAPAGGLGNPPSMPKKNTVNLTVP
ncbi:MAG: hypothetical protein ABIP51_18385 [Bacteroidia bacterium]